MFRVCIDAGHGGSEEGAVAGGFIESNLNLLVAYAVCDSLSGTGYMATLTRSADYGMTWGERNEAAGDANLVVSIHFNANPSSSVNGFEAYHWPGNADTRLIAVHASEYAPLPLKSGKIFAANADGEDNSWLQRPRTVLGAFDAPAVLFECAYLTNSRDVAYLESRRAIQQIATTIRAAIVRASDLLGD